MVALISITLLVANSVQQTASRLTWSLARDDALLCSRWFSKVMLEVPAPVLLLNAGGTFILGCIFLASTAAFNAILGSAIILQMLSFAIPIFFLVWYKRSPSLPPEKRAFKLPGWAGWKANIITILWAIVDYSVAVLAVMALIGVINWFAHARKHYRGPRIILESCDPLNSPY